MHPSKQSKQSRPCDINIRISSHSEGTESRKEMSRGTRTAYCPTMQFPSLRKGRSRLGQPGRWAVGNREATVCMPFLLGKVFGECDLWAPPRQYRLKSI